MRTLTALLIASGALAGCVVVLAARRDTDAASRRLADAEAKVAALSEELTAAPTR